MKLKLNLSQIAFLTVMLKEIIEKPYNEKGYGVCIKEIAKDILNKLEK